MDSDHKFKNSLTRLKKGQYAKTELGLSDMVIWNNPIKGEMCLQDLGTHSYALCDFKQQHIEKTKIKVEKAKKKAKMIVSVKPPDTVDHSMVQTGQSTDQPAMFIKI